MADNPRFGRLLKWYPRQWRERYGEEMAALLEESYPGGDVSVKVRVSLAVSGVFQRARGAGLLGSASSKSERVVAGSLLVLASWSLFVLAGSIFVKFSEHWARATPLVDRQLPRLGYNLVAVGGVLGGLAVGLAALVALPAFTRMVRTGQWTSVRAHAWRALCAGTLFIALTGALALWAHHENSHYRNGGSFGYGFTFVLWGVSFAGAVALTTVLVVAIGRRLRLTSREVTVMAVLACALGGAALTVIVGTGLWWGSEAIYAPNFLRNSIGWDTGNLPLMLDAAGVVMVVGMAGSVAGIVRVMGTMRAPANRAL